MTTYYGLNRLGWNLKLNVKEFFDVDVEEIVGRLHFATATRTRPTFQELQKLWRKRSGVKHNRAETGEIIW
jgi:hypothetical protein